MKTAYIRKGVRQECALSPIIIFNAYIQRTLSKFTEAKYSAVKIPRIKIKMPRFADDIAIIVENKTYLDMFINKLETN